MQKESEEELMLLQKKLTIVESVLFLKDWESYNIG